MLRDSLYQVSLEVTGQKRVSMVVQKFLRVKFAEPPVLAGLLQLSPRAGVLPVVVLVPCSASLASRFYHWVRPFCGLVLLRLLS